MIEEYHRHGPVNYPQPFRTPDQIADFIEDWFQDSAADGFNIMPPLLRTQLDLFSAEMIPILQHRRLFRTEYEGSMLHEHYGLPWPTSVFDDPAWTAEPLQDVAAYDRRPTGGSYTVVSNCRCENLILPPRGQSHSCARSRGVPPNRGKKFRRCQRR
jgi:hypothetical protein